MVKHRSLWSVVLGACAVFALVLSGCGGATTGNTTTSNQPKFGGTVTDALFEEPDNMMVGQSNETYSALLQAAIWAPLFYTDSSGAVQPGLVTEVPTVANGGISSDFKTYTFHLRQGLKWSDGTPLTANDVVFTMNLMSNPAYAPKTSWPASNIASVTAQDPQTVVVTLKQVQVTFISYNLTDALTFEPIPQSVYGSMDPSKIASSQQAFIPPVSSGPFTLSERVAGDHFTVVKNKNYYQAPKPYLDKIIFKVVPDANTILTALQSGQIDTSWFLDVTKMTQYKALAPGYEVALPKQAATWEAAFFNLATSSHNILADLQVRKAISAALDTDAMIKNILAGTGQQTCDDAPATFAHDTTLKCHTFDVNAAKSLLDSDGWTMGSDGYRHKNGVTLELRWSTTSNNNRREETELAAQQDLKNVGIKMDIVNYPANTYFGTVLPDGNFDIGEYASSASGGDPADNSQWDCDQFPSAGGFNVGHWCDQTATTADKAALTNPDQTFRTQQYHTLYQQIADQVPAVFLYAYPDIAIHSSKVQGYAPGPFGPEETAGVWNWWRTDATGSAS
jgi:peptide/nickel transport system substrate-binding protein